MLFADGCVTAEWTFVDIVSRSANKGATSTLRALCDERERVHVTLKVAGERFLPIFAVNRTFDVDRLCGACLSGVVCTMGTLKVAAGLF